MLHFQVKHTQKSTCSVNSVTVMKTNICIKCVEIAHFHISGNVFGSLANYGQTNNLHYAGKSNVAYQS